MAALGGAPSAVPGQPHAGGGVQRLMFITYVNIEDQRRDEGHRYAVYLAHRTEALALQTAEEEDRLACTMCGARGYSGTGTTDVGAC